jgi:hypothetical protein
MEEKVNGALWSPGTVKCTLLVDNTNNVRIVSFTATSAAKTITIEAYDQSTGGALNTGTRSYSSGTACFLYNTSTNPYHTVSGTINITAVEASAQLVTGSFSFTMEDDDGNLVQVSDGKFVKLNYSVITH